MRRTDFHYDLPDELIARHPAPQRSGSRLLHLDGATGALHGSPVPRPARPAAAGRPAGVQRHARDPGAAARPQARQRRPGRDPARAAAPARARRCVQLRASKPSRPGAVIGLGGGDARTVVERDEDFWRVEFSGDAHGIFERLGEMPLPPYIARAADAADRERYQTVYAREPGAVAAPTAGLHFDDAAARRPAARRASEFAYVTLHVGAGTFQPVRVDDLARAPHARRAVRRARTRPARRSPRRARAAVASSRSARPRCARSRARRAHGALEPYAGETRLFITPGHRFRVVDALVTNFHLPESTLLMLVCAFAGREHVLRGVPSRGRAALPLLQLRRRDVRRAGAGRARARERA